MFILLKLAFLAGVAAMAGYFLIDIYEEFK